MRILFLNQYFPPDPAPTGILFAELAERLRAAGHETDFISAGQGYRSGQGKGGRMRREAAGLLRILRDGFLSRRADIVISGSSPPCLLMVATIVAARHRAASLHWAMDLYPELAVMLGELKEGAISRAIGALMTWSYRRTTRTVALDDDMAARLSRQGIGSTSIRPWVFAPVLEQLKAVQGTEPEGGSSWTWVYSGNLGRAHEWNTILEAQKLLEESSPRIRLRFQGGGPSWPQAQARAQELGIKNCEWKPYVDESQLAASLLRCHACVVTQKPEAQGLLWPSKLGLVLGLARPLVWIGPADGAVAQELKALPHAGVFAPGQSRELSQWLISRSESRHPIEREMTIDPFTQRTEALVEWERLVAECEAVKQA